METAINKNVGRNRCQLGDNIKINGRHNLSKVSEEDLERPKKDLLTGK